LAALGRGVVSSENKKNEKEFERKAVAHARFTGQTATVYQSPYATVAG